MKQMTSVLALSLGLTSLTAFAGPTQVYRGHGVTFRYPAGMSVQTQLNGDVSTIILQDQKDQTTVTVQICPPVLTTAQVGAGFMHGIETQVGPGSHMTGPTPARTQVAGAAHQGREYRLTLGGTPGLVKLFSFSLGGKVLNVAEFRPDTPAIRAGGEAEFTATAASVRVQQ